MKNILYIIIFIFISSILNNSCVATSQQTNIIKISKRWKALHYISDFLYIKDHYIPIGTDITKVRKLLGIPLYEYSDDKGNKYLMYTKCDAIIKQYYSWTCVIDKNGKVIEWHKKGIK